MKNLIIIFSAFIFFTSCKKECEDVDGNLSTEELSWFSYKGGEVLIFKSNTNLNDTLRVGSMRYSYNSGYIEVEDPCQHHQECCRLQILGNNRDFAIGGCHNNQWNHGNVGIEFQNKSFIFTDLTPQNNILISGLSYNNVYIISVDTISTNLDPLEVWRVYYTKQNGILRYDVTQGQFYEKIN